MSEKAFGGMQWGNSCGVGGGIAGTRRALRSREREFVYGAKAARQVPLLRFNLVVDVYRKMVDESVALAARSTYARRQHAGFERWGSGGDVVVYSQSCRGRSKGRRGGAGLSLLSSPRF